jgi:eukaryotic-like serine/threonine-protein kinase
VIAGRYTLVREIGRGGMGAVWLARDEVLGREVAVKRIGMFPGGATPDLARAEREAKLAAKLNHPHVVAIFDFVSDGDEQWLVMERVEGVTLSELARGRGLPSERAGDLIRQAAEALAAAHAAGIVHRDVKPSNILVTSDGTAKLTDFGIAKAQADATLTQTGLVTGSPAYLAPEVASGGNATTTSDVWSLGATLFHALSGRPPYENDGNVVGTLYRIVHEQPPRLPTAGWLAPVLEATMAVDPDQRWSMAQVRDFLAAGPSAPPVAHVPVPQTAVLPAPDLVEHTRFITTTRPAPRRAGWPLAAIAAAVAIAVIVGLFAWLALRDPGGGSDDQAGSGGPSKTSTSTTKTTSPGARPTAAAIRSFIRDYVQQAVADPAQAFDHLTPDFQRASKGLRGYEGFWGGIRWARVSNVVADPSALTVGYDVRYKPDHGRPFDNHVELGLAFSNGSYLIANER